VSTVYQYWREIVGLFKKRGLPESTYENLYEEEYILHPGKASLSKTLRLDDHEFRHENPWIKAGGRPQYEGIDGAITGYVIDGDLEVDGSIINGDEGSPALVVLGNLRAKNLWITGDTKLLVKGDVEVDTFIGSFGSKLLMVHGDLRAKVAVFTDEFSPDLVGGSFRAHLVAPPYYDVKADENVGSFEDTSAGARLADRIVPEVRVDEARAKKTKVPVDARVWHERLVADLPILLK
jgi:hypothetical protein